jgi:hypothetical protein
MVAAALLALALLAAPLRAQDAPALLVHVPVVQAQQHEPIDVVVAVADFTAMDGVELYLRAVGEPAFAAFEFQRRDDGDWVVTIPSHRVEPPGLEYYIASGGHRRFASQGNPQRIEVEGQPGYARMMRELARYDGQRSVFGAQADFLSFGSDTGLADQFFVGSLDYRYRILGPIRSLHFGFTSLRAAVVDSSGDRPVFEAGVDVGFAEIELAPAELVGLEARLELGANAKGFLAGFLAGLRIGHDPGTHVDLRAGYLHDVGRRFELGLTWDTVPRIPMDATLWVSDWPDWDDPAVGVRYQAIVPLGEHADLAFRLGYQARYSELGGIAGGLGFSWGY